MPRRFLIVSFSSILLLAAAIPLAGCDDGGGDRTTTPLSSPAAGSPAPSATPTPPPPDPTLARDLRYRGEYEAAADVFAAVAASTTGDDRVGALLEQARMAHRAGDPAQARAALDTAVAEAGAAAEGSLAQYLLASTLDDLGEDASAVDLYSRYVLAGGTLASYANIERAKLLAALARGPEAEPIAQGVLADPAAADLLGSFALSMGSAYASAALDADALRWFALVGPNDGDVASALTASGAVRQRLGDPAWTDDYLNAMAIAPSAGAPLLDALDTAAVPVGDYLRGLVEYRAFRNDAARASLERAVAAGDNPGEALYYLGALDERAEDDAAAILRYQQSYDANPASTLADSALWWRGRLLENAGRHDEAILAYTLLSSNYPASEWGDGAAFRIGLVQYKAGRFADAAGTFAALSTRDGSEGFRARLWQGRALLASGNSFGDSVLRQLAGDAAAHGDYYAVRAAALLGDKLPAVEDPDLDALDPDWPAIQRAFAPPPETTTPTPTSTPAPVDLDADPRWQRAAALDVVGLGALAGSLRSDILSDAALAGERDLLAVTRRFFEQGDESYTARAAATLLSVLPSSQEPPRDLLRLAYPPAYTQLVTDAAETEGIDPLWLLALMRQESLYDPDAGSVAGAIGLMQIIPTTGESLAAELGVADGFQPGDLFRPVVSVPFGARYLSGQFEAWDGNIHHALAAYNGGPGATIDARALAGDDLDLFVEELEFEETRLYVRRVWEHYARYVEAYGQ